MNSTIKCIIFDMGNVLLNWDVHQIYDRIFPTPKAVDSFLHEINFTEWNTKQDAGRSFKEAVAELSEKFPHYADLIQAYDTHWEESISEVISGTVDILYRLKNQRWNLHLLSNVPAEKFTILYKKHDFLHLFDQLIISGEIKMIKPNLDIFHYTLNKIQLPAHECLFIDDSLPNILAAQSLGIQTIHFESPEQLDRKLQSFQI